MPENIPIFSTGSLLVESPKRENEEHFHAYLTELLEEIYARLPDWMDFRIGSRYERNGVSFREFLCVAGSVTSRIQIFAQRPGGISRKIILRGVKSDSPYCCEIDAGLETEFDCKELQKIK